jgi:hypothetical protein
MSTASLVFWVNPDTNAIMSGWNSSSVLPTPTFKQGDTVRIELHLVRMTESSGKVMEELEWSPSANIKLAIGKVQARPTFGTYTLTFGSNETAPIAFDATDAEVESAINAMAGVSAIGGVSVSVQGTAYRIVFNTARVLPFALNYNENDLFPTSSIGVALARAGTASIKAIYQVQIKQSPVASVNNFAGNTLAVATSTVLKSSAFAGDTKVWRVLLSPAPRDGSFSLAYTDGGSPVRTPPLDVNSVASEVQTALLNATSPANTDWVVANTGAYQWDITTTKASISALTVDGSGMFDYSGKVGLLSLNTVEVENLLSGDSSTSAVMEIEVDNNGSRHTILQTAVNIVNDLIDEADYTIMSREEVMPVDSVVRYDTSQTLTSAQKLQARTNIGASGSTVDVDALQTEVGNLDTRLSNIEGNSLTADQYGAIQWAELPTATNQFITESALTTTLDGYSDITHTHAVAGITGLQAVLDAKANIAHTHTTEEVIGLEDELLTIQTSVSGKANLSHTHTIAQIQGLAEALDVTTSYVTYPDLQMALAGKANSIHEQGISTISGLQAQLNTYNGYNTRILDLETSVGIIESETLPTRVSGLETRMGTAEADILTLQGFVDSTQNNASGAPSSLTTHYPLEIVVVINGSAYALPARLL